MTLREHIENQIIEEIKKASDDELVLGDAVYSAVEEMASEVFCEFCKKTQGGSCKWEKCPGEKEAKAIMRMEYEA